MDIQQEQDSEAESGRQKADASNQEDRTVTSKGELLQEGDKLEDRFEGAGTGALPCSDKAGDQEMSERGPCCWSSPAL